MIGGVILGNRRFLRPGAMRWLRAVGWMLLLAVAVLISFAFPAGIAIALGSWLRGEFFVAGQPIAAGPAIAGAIFGAICAYGAYAGLVRLAEARWPAELDLARLPGELIGGLAAGAGMQALAVGMLGLFGWATVTAHPITDWLAPIDETIQSGTIEELMFRLVIFRLLWRAFGVWPALMLSALLFGVVHLTNPNANWFAAICIAVEAGVMLATFYILTGRIWVSVGVHAGWNYTQGWIFGAAVSGTDSFAGGPLSTVPNDAVPYWLSGGAFGPEASLAGLIVGTGVGVWMLWLAARRGSLIAADERAAPPQPAAEDAPVAG